MCDEGVAGEHCDVNIDECEPSPCLNGGECTDGDNSYTCSCSNGYSGSECEVYTECTRAVCSDHGECEVCNDNYIFSFKHQILF